MLQSALTHLPGPPPVTLFGWRANLLSFLLDPIGYMDRLPTQTGLVQFVQGGSRAVLLQGEHLSGSVFAFGPEANRAVLGDMASFYSRPLPGPPESSEFARLTSGLFSMNLEKHKQQRSLVQPALHKQRVAGYHADMVELTQAMLDGWQAGKTLDILGEFTRLSFSIANRSLFGLTPDQGLSDLGERILEVITLSVSPLTLLPAWIPWTPRRRLVMRAAQVEGDLRTLINLKRDNPRAQDVLADLVSARDEEGDTLTDEELLGQTFLLFFAGHDTTRSALAWTLLLLAQHPQIMQDLTDELVGALHGGPPELGQLGQLPLLDAVVKESLRLFPPAPWTLRESVREVEIAGTLLPPGTETFVSYYHTHRDPDLFPDPTHFLPHRWMGMNPVPFAYLPFGAGARLCVGAAFASQELRLVLAMLLQRFHPVFASGSHVDRQARIVMTPGLKLPMLLKTPGQAGQPARLEGNVRQMVMLP